MMSTLVEDNGKLLRAVWLLQEERRKVHYTWLKYQPMGLMQCLMGRVYQSYGINDSAT
ncbi:hypothetical protein HanPSC8_Chr16g0705861 [Helianthus annuus]|nr:hypothetical protein HanPSC8_Chr16g0705861 [Helianthus annuus]